MKPGQASKTAVLVCMGRALADSDPSMPAFSDPTAFALLPDDARERVEWMRAGTGPKGLRKMALRGYLLRLSKVMAARTLAIDSAVREAASPQVVILGAGLDGRAWRMPELSEVVVFEVDHPDSQREKRANIRSLVQTAHAIRFAPVDFARDNLDDALTRAGHARELPTTWIWEGVVMYLEQAAIEATLDVISKRSAKGSRLIVLYHHPSPLLRVVGPIVRWVGEPLRSSFLPEQMRALLARYGLEVVRDESISEIGQAMPPEIAAATRVVRHLRVVTATRI